RDGHVTGVQTCALPIWAERRQREDSRASRPPVPPTAPQRLAAVRGSEGAVRGRRRQKLDRDAGSPGDAAGGSEGASGAEKASMRSEERRVGEECGAGGG